MAKKRRVSITEAEDGEWLKLELYVAEKKRWKDLPAFFRDAAYQHQSRNALTPAQEARVAERLKERRGGGSAALREAT